MNFLLSGVDTNNVILAFIALMNCITAFIAYQTHNSSKNNHEAIVKLEKNTNSLKDALVASTAKASFSEGETKAREAGEAKAEALLEKNNKQNLNG